MLQCNFQISLNFKQDINFTLGQIHCVKDSFTSNNDTIFL